MSSLMSVMPALVQVALPPCVAILGHNSHCRYCRYFCRYVDIFDIVDTVDIQVPGQEVTLGQSEVSP